MPTPTVSRERRLGAWWLLVVGGLALLVLGGTGVLPDVTEGIGAVAVTSAYTWALAARTGGRPIVFAALAAVAGAAVLLLDTQELRTGAAVMTCTVGAVLGVMATVPARQFLIAVREVVIAVVLSGGAAVAAVGYAPTISLARFEYTVLALSFLVVLGLVYRLGAGLHGLGRRGVIAVVVGSLVLAVILAYAEALRRYGATSVVGSVLDSASWMLETVGGVPRPIQAALGVPALAWGTYMRARRRQGWWLCIFGVAATAPVANGVMNPSATLLQALLGVVYSLVIGFVIAYVVIRADLALTGSRGSRARRNEERSAVRPEPSRTRPLL
ncbi:hypothetical protein QE364_003163 [Nocardioides zeae]|uniref:Uncharacterized protein n=2 Tax=Nocardioides zeae TaxID=1457234 RepID=A0AAJ1U678_9ACTN|nr:hypothetical protein [Nocardioides zeae]MDQ1106308.1 hypothetical protein [Nocardioides zeae]MDR6174006.1 hypothetical protein [Nocardioides zeae]MDR6211439.1 hypothetical protein [Nocardioides zeae]